MAYSWSIFQRLPLDAHMRYFARYQHLMSANEWKQGFDICERQRKNFNNSWSLMVNHIPWRDAPCHEHQTLWVETVIDNLHSAMCILRNDYEYIGTTFVQRLLTICPYKYHAGHYDRMFQSFYDISASDYNMSLYSYMAQTLYRYRMPAVVGTLSMERVTPMEHVLECYTVDPHEKHLPVRRSVFDRICCIYAWQDEHNRLYASHCREDITTIHDTIILLKLLDRLVFIDVSFDLYFWRRFFSSFEHPLYSLLHVHWQHVQTECRLYLIPDVAQLVTNYV
jgi:hypothetical protein